MPIETILNQYDLGEIYNRKDKKLIEDKMNRFYNVIYYCLQYLREICMIVGVILLIIWFFKQTITFFYYGVLFWIVAGILAVITQKMRQYIIIKYKL